MTGESILIVDDNLINLKLVRVLLEGEGYEVKTATDARETFEILREFHPRLILMDIQLPDMDGLELTRRLKADPGMDNVRIIALTAYAMKGDEQRALEAGCHGYIPKPIDTRELTALLSRYLQGGNSEKREP